MAVTTLSSREFNQEVGRAKKAAKLGPVFVTDRGKPTHVLLDIDEYRKIAARGKSIVEMLWYPEVAEIEVEFPRIDETVRGFDFD
jgi:prevent-host-death family protein